MHIRFFSIILMVGALAVLPLMARYTHAAPQSLLADDLQDLDFALSRKYPHGRADTSQWRPDLLRAEAIIIQVEVTVWQMNDPFDQASQGFYLPSVGGKFPKYHHVAFDFFVMQTIDMVSIQQALISMVREKDVLSSHTNWPLNIMGIVPYVDPYPEMGTIGFTPRHGTEKFWMSMIMRNQRDYNFDYMANGVILVKEAVDHASTLELITLEDWIWGKPTLVRDIGSFEGYLETRLTELPKWISDNLGDSMKGITIQGGYTPVVLDDPNRLGGYSMNRRDDLHKSLGLVVKRGQWNIYSQVGGNQSTQWDQSDGASVFLETGGARRVWNSKVDIFGAYRMNMNRRNSNPYRFSLEDQRELIRFGARYHLFRRGGPQATIDVIYFFENPIRGIIDASGEQFGLRAGFQYLF